MAVDELVELLMPSREVQLLKSADFKGSLDYIDRLPVRPPLSIKSGLSILGRDADVISKAASLSEIAGSLLPAALPLGEVIPADNRFWSPGDYDPGELVSGASRLVDDWIPFNDPEKPGRDYRVNTETGEIVFIPRIHRKGEEARSVSRFRFEDPLHLAICLKRKLRRVMMFAKGKAGFFYRPKNYGPYSRVRC